MVAWTGIRGRSSDRHARSALERPLRAAGSSEPGSGAFHERHAGHAVCDAQWQPVRTDMACLRGPRRVRVVSTFPLAHAEIYGEDFLLDCARFNVPLTLVHYERFDTVLDLGEVRIDATDDPEVRNFLFDCHLHGPPTDTYRHQARRFGFKAFAMTRPDIRETDWLVWLDADVRMHNDPDWQSLFNHRADVCYLGRSEW